MKQLSLQTSMENPNLAENDIIVTMKLPLFVENLLKSAVDLQFYNLPERKKRNSHHLITTTEDKYYLLPLASSLPSAANQALLCRCRHLFAMSLCWQVSHSVLLLLQLLTPLNQAASHFCSCTCLSAVTIPQTHKKCTCDGEVYPTRTPTPSHTSDQHTNLLP